jgi:hypothetical protein
MDVFFVTRSNTKTRQPVRTRALLRHGAAMRDVDEKKGAASRSIGATRRVDVSTAARFRARSTAYRCPGRVA